MLANAGSTWSFALKQPTLTMLPALLYRKCGSESTSLQEFVGENNRGVSGKPGRKLDGVLHKVLHFFTLGGEALADLNAGAA